MKKLISLIILMLILSVNMSSLYSQGEPKVSENKSSISETNKANKQPAPTQTSEDKGFIDEVVSALEGLGLGDLFPTDKWIGIKFERLFLSFVVIVLTLLLNKIVFSVVFMYILKLTSKTKTKIDDYVISSIKRPINLFGYVLGIYLAVLLLNPPTEPVDIEKFVDSLFIAMVIIVVTWIALRLIDIFDIITENYKESPHYGFAKHLLPFFKRTIKILVVIVSGITIIQNLGYSVSSLLAGLGLGGMALALASRDTVANFFGSFMIFMDKPFTVGDWIKASGVEGDVEEIGFRSTKIRTFRKSLVSVPNNKIANDIIENMTARPKQREYAVIGIEYSTPREKVSELIERIKKTLEEHPWVDNSYYQVWFRKFSDSSLDIMLYYFIDRTPWADFLQAVQEVNLAIMKHCEELNISFAFPSTSVYFGDESPSLPDRNS